MKDTDAQSWFFSVEENQGIMTNKRGIKNHEV